MALIGISVGIGLMAVGIAIGDTAGLALLLLGGVLGGATPVLALAPAMRNPNAKPPEHPHSTFGDMIRMIERVPPPQPRREPPEDPTESR